MLAILTYVLLLSPTAKHRLGPGALADHRPLHPGQRRAGCPRLTGSLPSLGRSLRVRSWHSVRGRLKSRHLLRLPLCLLQFLRPRIG